MERLIISAILLILNVMPFSLFAFERDFSCEVPDTVKELKEVSVVGNLTERLGNRESFLVTKQMRERSHDAGEMLTGLKGIFYDPISTNVKYLGSENVVILVDSVQKDASYIKRMNPKRFDRIDIISFPDGKYAGYDAVINYHTIPQYIGYDGVAKGEIKIIPNDYNGKGKQVHNSNDVAEFTFTKNKLNFALTGMYDFKQTGSSEYSTVTYPYNSLIETSLIRSKKNPATDKLDRSVNASVSVDYQINTNHSVSFSYRIRPENNRLSTKMDYEMVDGSGRYDTLSIESVNRTRSTRHYLGFFYRGRLKKRWSIDGTLSYNFSDGRYRWEAERSSGFRTNYNSEFFSGYLWGGIVLSRYSKNRKFAYGANYYITDIHYDLTRISDNWEKSETKELRNRAALNLSYYPNRTLSMGGYIGLNTVSRRNEMFSKTFKGAVGRGWVNYFFGRNNGIRFNYTLNQIYPSLGQIQDYGYFRDSLIYTKGNPELKPAINHKFSLVAFFNNGLTVKADYSLTESEQFLIRYLGEGSASIMGEPNRYVIESFSSGTGQSVSLNVTYYKLLNRHFDFSVDGGIERRGARYRETGQHKTMPNISWWIRYSYSPQKVMVYLSGTVERDYMLPRRRLVGATQLDLPFQPRKP